MRWTASTTASWWNAKSEKPVLPQGEKCQREDVGATVCVNSVGSNKQMFVVGEVIENMVFQNCKRVPVRYY
jgi:hypothetical protein